jgi:outer membrane lipoprotein SlyB
MDCIELKLFCVVAQTSGGGKAEVSRLVTFSIRTNGNNAVGLCVGSCEGALVGTAVGAPEGTLVGTTVGDNEGTLVGTAVGTDVGLWVISTQEEEEVLEGGKTVVCPKGQSWHGNSASAPP